MYIYNIYNIIYIIYTYIHICKKQDGHNIYMYSRKQWALPIITTIVVWQLMHAGIWRTVTHCFSWLHVYITLILLPWDLSTLRIVNHLWLLIIRSLLGLLSSLVPITCNCTSCTHVYELAQNHCGDKSLIIVMLKDRFLYFLCKKSYLQFESNQAGFY